MEGSKAQCESYYADKKTNASDFDHRQHIGIFRESRQRGSRSDQTGTITGSHDLQNLTPPVRKVKQVQRLALLLQPVVGLGRAVVARHADRVRTVVSTVR